MTKHTITIAQARACHPLASAVLRQLGHGRITREAIDAAIEAGRHGADAGWPGFTYTSDAVAFARANALGIVTAVEHLASDLGEEGAVSFVRGWRSVKDAGATEADVASALYGRGDTDGADGVLNALAWFALEEVGRAIEAEAER